MNQDLKKYLELQSKFSRMEKLIDIWAVDYAMEQFIPLIDEGFEYEDIQNFIITRWDAFVKGDKIDVLLEKHRKAKQE